MRMCPLCVGLIVVGAGVGLVSMLGSGSAPGVRAEAPLSAAAPTAEGAYTIDPVHSGVVFRIQHFGAGMFRGMFHGPAGTFTLDPAKPEAGSMEVTIKAENLSTANDKRDQHLKSPDFFSAKEFPTIKFASKSMKKTGEKAYEVSGDLTLHGVTKPVTAQVAHTGTGKGQRGGELMGLEATFSIKRSDFGMNYMPGALGDEVQLIVFLEGGR